MKSYFTSEKSTRITYMEYDTETKILIILFKKGGKYQYEEVPWGVWEELKSSTSVGKSFNDLIKGKYSFSKLL